MDVVEILLKNTLDEIRRSGHALSKIRKGSQGAVVKTVDGNGQEIALKIIDYSNRANATKAIQDFEREFHALQLLYHPSIVHFLGFNHDPDNKKAYLRMEWAASELSSDPGNAIDLGDIICHRHDQLNQGVTSYLPESFIWHVLFHLGASLALCHHGIELHRESIAEQAISEDVLSQLLEDPPERLKPLSRQFISIAQSNPVVTWTAERINFSMKNAHEPIVHRDIKPRNIILSDPPRNESDINWRLEPIVSLEDDRVFRVYPNVLLGDFGLSAPLRDARTRGIGTVGYTAPEVPSEPSRPGGLNFEWTTSCDIFSLGASVRHLMTLQAPPEYWCDSSELEPFPSVYSVKLQQLVTQCHEISVSKRPTAIDILDTCIEHSYWDKTYVSPYGVPIAFDFTMAMGTSWHECVGIVAPEFRSSVVPVRSAGLVSRGLDLLFLGRAAGKANIIAGAYITRCLQYKMPPSSMIPFSRDRMFVGREYIFESIKCKQELSQGHCRLGLVGLGGIGKSQIAIEYAYRVRDTTPQTSVFWIHANNGARFEQGYREIARKARLLVRDDSSLGILRQVYEWLSDETNGRWLLILDNVDDDSSFFEVHENTECIGGAGISVGRETLLASFLPQTPNGSILVTSRNFRAATNLVGMHGNIIRVDSMDESDALALLNSRIPFSESLTTDARELVHALDYIPLAITQAAAFIQMIAPRMTISTYLRLFREGTANQRRLLGDEHAKDLRRDPTLRHSVTTTWQITFEQVRTMAPAAADLLALMSMFDAQGIPEDLLHHDMDQLEFESAITPLISFSLVKTQKGQQSFEMHRLVQVSMIWWLELHGELERWRAESIRIMARAFPSGEYETWARCQVLLPHSKEVLSYASGDEHEELDTATIAEKTGRYLFLRGGYADAEQMQRRALEGRKKALGKEHPDILTSVRNLAEVLQFQGRYEEAEMMNRQALEGYEKALGNEHPNTLTSLSNLASVLQLQGRYKEAEVINRQTLAGYEKALGVEHPDTLISVSRLGTVLERQGKYEEAEAMHRQALAGSEKVLGVEHPDTLTIVSQLGTVLERQGKYEEAEAMHRRALAGSEMVLGIEHPSTLTSMANLASTYWNQGRWKEAEELDVQVMETSLRVLGEEHPSTLTSMANLAHTWKSQSRNKEAISLMEKCFKLQKQILGTYHPNTKTSLKALEQWQTDDLGIRYNAAVIS